MVIADLHIHGRYAQGCSRNTTLDLLEKYARVKGIDVLGCGDFTHPFWIKEIREKLEEDEDGILWSKTKFPFLWQTEISFAYTQGGKGRRVHLIVLAPSYEVVRQITDELLKKGRVDYDGRPIFGMSCIEFVEIMKGISSEIEIICAHSWTPWFGVFGSKSGFDSLKEAFGERVKDIHAIETGMSSDPAMNWRVKELDNFRILSFSDTHSYWPWRLGRECTVFDCNLSYKKILNAIRTGEGLKSTVETDPNYGIYHYDGHRKCGVCLSPSETKKVKGVCPKCGRQLTIGVEYRIEELASREMGFRPAGAKDFVKLTPLTELIAAVWDIRQLGSAKVWAEYNKLVKEFGNEFNVLLNTSREDLLKVSPVKLVDVIMKNRSGELRVSPGYDGVYGKIDISDSERMRKQKTLEDFQPI